MNIAGSATTSLLNSILDAETARAEVGVAVLKKANDVQTQQGQAMIKMLEESAPAPADQGFSAYA